MWSPTSLLSLTPVHVPLVSAFFTVSIIRHSLIADSALWPSVLHHAELEGSFSLSPTLSCKSPAQLDVAMHDVAKVETNRDGPSWEIYGCWRKVRRIVRGCVGVIDVCYGGGWSKLLLAGDRSHGLKCVHRCSFVLPHMGLIFGSCIGGYLFGGTTI